MPRIGPLELVIILAVVLLLFGATRLPKLAQSMGQAIREFRKSASETPAAPATKRRHRTPAKEKAGSNGSKTA
ncbi:MAG: twin-arginine translocase TatA/TatE family subunit [Dehalococcoidia bacterium]|nr:twin-arginine translocase TatA/TatE family subunit [Dehalococcoidia bacterium]